MIWIEKIQEAINFIEENLFDAITVDSVGRAINYSPSSLSSFFSAITGYSVGEYIRYRRLSCAADILARDAATVTEVAFSCGYESPEAFSKAFKRLFGCSPSQFSKSEFKYHKFAPIAINFSLDGGFSMTRNMVPGLGRVDWSDTQRQNEYVNSVISAIGAIGDHREYDAVCAMSGSAFRTSFSMPGVQAWNHGNYHVVNTPIIIGHTFRVLGYSASINAASDFKTDSQLIMRSIDRGVPVLTLEGVINCSDACVISGYDVGGQVLLGYSPFMYIEDDHNEVPDDTGYFRKSNWHVANGGAVTDAKIIAIGERLDPPGDQEIFDETLRLISRLIGEESLYPGQYNGLAAHSAFANALMTYEWEDNSEPYLNTMCNYKQYLDRKYAVRFFEDNGRDDLAGIYKDIAELVQQMGEIIPQDFSAGEVFNDKASLKPYAGLILKIRDLEETALTRI